MVHKPKHRVHSFRGLLTDGGQDEINLERQNVNLAYRVVKFQIMSENPYAGDAAEHVVKIYREEQSTIDGNVNFTEGDLLGVAIINNYTSGYQYPSIPVIIFDNVLFSRNIFVTHDDVQTTSPNGLSCNYYIELEEVPVNAATLMQLKLGVARKLNLTEGPYIPPS